MASGGPGFTESALFLPRWVLFAYLPPRLTDCTVGGAMLFITTTSGSSVSRRCTQQQHISSCLLGFSKIFSISLCLSCSLESHTVIVLLARPPLHACHTLSPPCHLLTDAPPAQSLGSPIHFLTPKPCP